VDTFSVVVTPRFEIFYALQALESGTGERLAAWRREMERRLPARARTEIARVAPSPLMWPLLADALREQPPSISFVQILSALHAMDDAAFQRSVLGGVFKIEGAVNGLMSGRTSLKRTVAAAAKTQEKLLSLLGLHPFDANNASTYAFERIVSQPSTYRSEMLGALDMFWQVGFNDTWTALSAQMTTSARAMKTAISRSGFTAFAAERKLPAAVNAAETLAVHVIPSAFNVARLWAAYKDSHERTVFYIPVLDTKLSPVAGHVRESRAPEPVTPVVDPALVFKALGDTTRYAIATTLARSPMTSVELARLFKVSKPTISHHVAQMRAANLLIERQTESGIVLSLNRRVLERASDSAAKDMYSPDGPDHVIKRSRRSRR
jgi:ArsR family transcriptional regulator, repressor of sdpIR and other operons